MLLTMMTTLPTRKAPDTAMTKGISAEVGANPITMNRITRNDKNMTSARALLIGTTRPVYVIS